MTPTYLNLKKRSQNPFADQIHRLKNVKKNDYVFRTLEIQTKKVYINL